jgi:hypothetical protein
MGRTLLLLGLAGLLGTFGCSAETSQDDAAAKGDDQNATSEAKIEFLSGFKTKVTGTPTAGKPVSIAYALDRLPQCRGNVGGGGPGWTITGFYSENGGTAKPFDVTALSPDGKDRVAKPATIVLSQGGDVAMWFQVTSRFGCSEFDSAFGQNFHFDVKGAEPQAGATITFGASGDPRVEGRLEAGGKVRVHYEQDRLPKCRRSQGGYPQWAITGFSQLDREQAHTFDTGRPNGSDREEVDAVIDLPHAGDLALWFQVVSVGGCMEYDSKGGANYKFRVE